MRLLWAAALPLMLFAGPALATGEDDVASEEETASVNEALAKINCRVGDNPVHKEENTFEIDDAECDIGQYDIKLDDQFNILLISRY